VESEALKYTKRKTKRGKEMNKQQKITMGITLIVMSGISMIWDTWGSDSIIIRQALEFIKYILAVLFLGGGIFVLFSLKKGKGGK
jgi:ABC-type microcin C transport system permease subunit YejB